MRVGLSVVDGLRGRLLAPDPQRSQEATVVRGQLERPAPVQQAGGRRHARHGRGIVPADETHDGLEGYAQVVSRLLGPRPALLDLRVVGNGGGDCVGQLLGEAVRDVIHSCSSSLAAGPGAGACPNPMLHWPGGWQGLGAKHVHLQGVSLSEGSTHCRGSPSTCQQTGDLRALPRHHWPPIGRDPGSRRTASQAYSSRIRPSAA